MCCEDKVKVGVIEGKNGKFRDREVKNIMGKSWVLGRRKNGRILSNLYMKKKTNSGNNIFKEKGVGKFNWVCEIDWIGL